MFKGEFGIFMRPVYLYLSRVVQAVIGQVIPGIFDIKMIARTPSLNSPRSFRACWSIAAHFRMSSTVNLTYCCGSSASGWSSVVCLVLFMSSFAVFGGMLLVLHDCCNSPSLRHASGDIFPNSRIPLLVMCVSSPPYCWAGE